jgi:hypothetical protein
MSQRDKASFSERHGSVAQLEMVTAVSAANGNIAPCAPPEQPISDHDRACAAGELIALLPHIDVVLDGYDAETSQTPAPWSRLGFDDAATRWLQVSHQVFTILAMGIDNLRAVREMTLVEGEMIVPLYAHYSVLRAVVEAAALTSWISQPDD